MPTNADDVKLNPKLWSVALAYAPQPRFIMDGKVYEGVESEGEVMVLVDGMRPLAPRYDLRNHSPSGFAWGYNGSGPAQLALAIMADAVGDADAVVAYQEFKARVVSRWEQGKPWRITQREVCAFIGRTLP
jgi:hypothetical protein